MLAVTRDLRSVTDERNGPLLQRTRGAEVAHTARQIPKQASHGLHCIRRGGEVQVRMQAVGPIAAPLSEKLADRHLQPPGGERLPEQALEPPHHAGEGRPLGDGQGLPHQLIGPLPHRHPADAGFAAAPAGLQAADQVEVAQLEHPALAASQPFDPPQIVAHEGLDPRRQGAGNRLEDPGPLADLLAPREQDRIQEDGPIVPTGLDGHEVEHPRLPLEAEPEPIGQEDEGPCGGGRLARRRRNAGEQAAEPGAEGLGRQVVASAREALQGLVLSQHAVEQPGIEPQAGAAPLAGAGPPRPLAGAALPAPRAKAVDRSLATGRFRM